LRLLRTRAAISSADSKISSVPTPTTKGKGEDALCELLTPIPPLFWVVSGVITMVGVCPAFWVATGVVALTVVGVFAMRVAVAVIMGVGVIIPVAVGVVAGVGVDWGVGGALLTVKVTDALNVGCWPAPAFATIISDPSEFCGIFFEREKEPLLSEIVEPKLVLPFAALNVSETNVPPGR
jgi:hypothetical protein